MEHGPFKWWINVIFVDISMIYLGLSMYILWEMWGLQVAASHQNDKFHLGLVLLQNDASSNHSLVCRSYMFSCSAWFFGKSPILP